MGRYTTEKSQYDNLAMDLFRSRGRAEILGGQLADVVAWNPRAREFDIVEVKSPRETDADIKYRYKENYDLGGRSREEIWRGLEPRFQEKERGIARLVAFTISNQLYTYWRNADKHVEAFRKRTGESVALSCVKAFLVLCSAHKSIATRVLESFDEIRWVVLESDARVCVFEIVYPLGKG